MNSKYEQKFFEKIVKESINIKDVTRNLGIGTTYGNRKTIKKYINLYNLNTSHFYVPRNNVNPKHKIDLSLILVSGSSYQHTSNLKKRLYKEGLKKRLCELCGQNEHWNGMQISLILDHKNGINNDNRIENLRIICPNCNAGQETFCRGNRRKKIKEYAQVDRLKLSLDQRKVVRPSLDQLMKEIKELGYSGTGRKYGVSDNAIRKWIKFYNLNIT